MEPMDQLSASGGGWTESHKAIQTLENLLKCFIWWVLDPWDLMGLYTHTRT